MSALATRYATAWITGASGGLGRAFVDMLLEEGVRVWGTARDLSRLAAWQGQAPFSPVRLDLADMAGATVAFAQAEAEAGGFDLVINNAGYGVFAPFAETDPDVWECQLREMLGGSLRLAQRALAGMRARQRGCLVNVSSLAAEFPLPFMSGYNIAKAGLSALSESLLFEYRGTPVRIIDFRPGDYRTGFNRAMVQPSHSGEQRVRMTAIWRKLEEHLAQGPEPEQAAADLRRALLQGREGVVRSGTFFQARLAPCLARLAPAALRRAIMRRYFDAG